MKAESEIRGSQAFTLIELLITISIILLLISLLLPALNRGKTKVKGLQCKSNLHQTGLGMILFAHGHEDKFPMQVSTNLGGSAEFINAGNAIQGDFYFSYKHFLPLAAELDNPKVLVCPADSRLPAGTFSSLRNTNLSYFVAANPVLGQTDSILSGDRNVTPVTNSTARVGYYRPLKWTGEMHQNRGNVLYADGHVDQINNVLSNSFVTPAVLIMPSTVTPASVLPADVQGVGNSGGGGGGGGASSPAISGGTLSVSTGSRNPPPGFTNGVLTNLTITSGPRNTPRSAYSMGGPGGDPPLPDLPQATRPSGRSVAAAPSAVPESSTQAVPPSPATDSAGEPNLEAAHQNLVDTGKALIHRGSRFVYGVPWWIIVGLLLLMLWLLRRAHLNAKSSAVRTATQRPGFVAPKRE